MTATIGSTGNILSLVSPTAAPIDEPNRPAFVSRCEEKALAERERGSSDLRREEEEANSDNL